MYPRQGRVRADAGRDPRRWPVQARAGHRLAPGRRHHRRRSRGPELLRQQLPRAVVATPPVIAAAHAALDDAASACRACASSAAPRTATRSSRRRLAPSSAPRTPSSTARASTPTAACSRPCSARRTRSSPTPSTTPRSSTASACARPSATATPTTTSTSSRPLQAARPAARLRMIATDGVFSMDGTSPSLDDLRPGRALRRHGHGRRQPRHRLRRPDRPRHPRALAACIGRVDIITSTLGKALGGAAGGFTTASGEIIELLRNRSRPYLFSNTLAPPIVAAPGRAGPAQRLDGAARQARRQHPRFRDGMTAAGFTIKPRRPPDRPGDARRRPPRLQTGRRPARGGHLRDRLLVPGRAARARPASASSSRPATPPSTSSARSPPSPRSAARRRATSAR
jgi:hypothetical protein